MIRDAAIIVLILALVGFSQSATIYVPDDQPIIQGVINAAMNGDTIIVRQGTYVENIDFIGKAIAVRSELGAEVTTIDGNLTGSVVAFKMGEGAGSVLHGFTVTNDLSDELANRRRTPVPGAGGAAGGITVCPYKPHGVDGRVRR